MSTTPIRDLEKFKKNALLNRWGLSYAEFRKSLTPHYSQVFLDILLGYILLLLSVYLPFLLWQRHPSWGIPLALVGGVSIGYWIAYLLLFIHEAAHYNLAPGRKLNDFLSNFFIASWAGLNTGSYRIIHWDHHRFLGKPNDTEHSYFSALNFRFIVESITGLAAIKVILFRRKNTRASRSVLDRVMMLVGLVLNIGVAGFLWICLGWPLGLAWVLGLTSFFPFFGALRQLLEHRDNRASDQIDYSKKPHGKVTRMFKEGPVGTTFGGAGFSRHLLHHWDPQVSYTRLADIEAFLMGTDLKDGMTKSTYLLTFFELFKF